MAPTADGARVDLHTLTPRHPDAPPRPKAVGLRVDYFLPAHPGRCPAQQHKPSRRGLHQNHRKVPETGGFQPGPGVSPDTKYPPGRVGGQANPRLERTFGAKPSRRGAGPTCRAAGVRGVPETTGRCRKPEVSSRGRGFGVSPRTAVGGWVETTWKALHWIREAQALRPSPPGRPGSRGERIAPAASETSSAQGPRKRRGCRTRRCRLRP